MTQATQTAAPSTAGPATATASQAPMFTHRQILTILSGLLLGMFLAALDQTIVSTAIRTIADQLHGLDQQAWATTAYLITSTISTPLYGKLSDIFGRKPLFLISISVFVIGSLACTFATSMYMLAGFRAFQGLGAGGLMSLAFAIIADIVPPRQMAKYQAYFLGVFASSSVLGPVIGGALAGQAQILGIDGWRWVFLVNVPIGIIALIVVTAVLNLPHTPRKHRIDWFGAVAIIVALVPLLIIAEQGREWGWTSEQAWICYGIGAIGLIGFVVAEYFAKDEALIPLRLFRSSVFSLSSLNSLIIGMAMFGGIALIPQYLQIVKGNTPTQSGLLMLPLMLGLMLSISIAGQITSRTGHYKFFPVIGTVFIAAGALLFSRIEWDSPLWQADVYMVVLGMGLGLCLQTLTLASQASVQPKDMGVATSTSVFFRQMGGTLGTAIFISLLFSTVTDNIKDAFTKLVPTQSFQAALHDPAVLSNPDNQPVLSALKGGGASSGVLQDSSFIQKLNPTLAQPFQEGFTTSMQFVFIAVAGVAALGFLVALFTKQVTLRAHSGLQAAAMEGGPIELPVEEPIPAPNQQFEPAPAPEPVFTPQHNGYHLPNPGGVSVYGTVRRADGSPVHSAALTVIDLAGKQIAKAVTDAQGGYGITAPTSGTYVLVAAAGAHQPQAAMIAVDGVPVSFDVVLTGTGIVVGVVSGFGGQPLAGATVTLTDFRGEVIGTQTTNDQGQYSFGGLVTGGYTIVVSANSYQPVASPLTIGDFGQVTHNVELLGGARVHGVTRNARGVPVADARVTLLDHSGTVLASTTTGLSGKYAFTDLSEGQYTVLASGYPPVATGLQVTAGQEFGHDIELTQPE